ncbi:MAG: carboxypeptidase regulatory-like domain-containing protein, partial [Acidobacteria bacterium]
MLRRFFFIFGRLGMGIGSTAILLCWNVLPARAQMGSVGTVNVIVLDPSGSAVQGAMLQLQDLATNETHSAETQQVGSYSFVTIPLGTYKLTVRKTGFETLVLSSVVVQGGRVTDVKVTLRVGAATETVIVESATPLVEATSNAIATTIDMKQINELPLQGRNIATLAFLSAGYSGTPVGGGGTWNGLPVIAQGNSIDGVISSTSRMKFSGNVQPGLQARLEDLEEMTVQTSQVDLNQSLGTSAMQVSFVTKRGSNDYHGQVFEDFRNSALNANSWRNNAIGLKKNHLILNEFGASLGGHLIKDRLFFFGSFAMAKQPGGFTAGTGIPGVPLRLVLSPAAQQGIFTYTSGPQKGQTVNLFTQVAQPNGLPSAVNAQIATQQALINKATSSGGVALASLANDPNLLNPNWAVSSPITRYFPALRLDYNVSKKVRIDFSWEETKFHQPNAVAPILPGSDFANQAAQNRTNNYTTSVGVNWTITPTLVNQFRGGYYYNAAWNAFGAQPLWLTQSQVSWAIPNLASGQSFNLPVSNYYPLVNFQDNATWLHGRHSAAFGVNFYREQDHYWNAPDGIPNITLGLVTGDPAFNAFETYFANASAADRTEAERLYATLIGRIRRVSPIGSGFPYSVKTGQYATTPGSAYNLDELQKGWGLYAQDSFRLTPHFTVNYGLRWDFTGDDHDLTSAYHGATQAGMYGPSGVGNIFKPGTLTGVPDPTYDASSHQYAPWNVSPQPTIGLAWNPAYSEGLLGRLFGGSNTVIRAGFDIKRFTEPYQYFWNNASNHGLAFFQTFSLVPVNGGGTGTFTPGSLSLGDALPPFLKSPSAYATSLPQSAFTWNYFWGASGIDPHIQQPYVQEWNLGIQRQIGRSNVLEVRYIGHRSVHQWIQTDPNEVNIFESGFLDQFKIAQQNLAINKANGINSFANRGFPGEQPLPFFDAAFACPPRASSSCTPGADYTNGSFINLLNRGAAGSFAAQLGNAVGTPYICNLVGSSLSPCAAQFGYTNPGPYPLNILQANPYAAGSIGQPQSWLSAGAYGNYHALQVDFRQKQWHGMQFDVNYTWSHTLGLQPDGQWLGTSNVFTMRDTRLAYGPTTFDLRHVVHASGTYDLPFGRGKALLNRSRILDRVVGGWTL